MDIGGAWDIARQPPADFASDHHIGDLGIYGIVNQIMMILGKLTFEDGKLVKARLQATHPLAEPVVSCLSRLLRDF